LARRGLICRLADYESGTLPKVYSSLYLPERGFDPTADDELTAFLP
jgi:hypothetical protein